MRTATLFLALLASTTAYAPVVSQDTPTPAPVSIIEESPPGLLSVEARQVTYFDAAGAQVISQPDGVRVVIDGDIGERRYGALVTLDNPEITWIEAYPNGQFPENPADAVIYADPANPGVFLVPGDPGGYVLLRISNNPNPPTWKKVEIGGKKPDDPPPPNTCDCDALEALSKARANAVNDPPTRSAIASVIRRVSNELEGVCRSGDCPDLAVARSLYTTEISQLLLSREGDSRDASWREGWQEPVGAWIGSNAPGTVGLYVQMMRAAADGLEDR